MGGLDGKIGGLEGQIGRLEGKIDGLYGRILVANMSMMVGVTGLAVAAAKFV